jgi:short-subunit dehydrogenase
MIQFDFNNTNLRDYQSGIFDKIQDLDISILINNVGVSDTNNLVD